MRLAIALSSIGFLSVLGPAVATTAGGAPDRSPEAPPVIRISVDRVQLDAVVTDKQGRHVTDLRPDELEVFQDGRKQQISEFAYVRVAVPGAVPAAPPSPTQAAAEPRSPAPAAAPAQERTILFVVDDLSLSTHSFDRMRRSLRHAVEQLDPRDRVDIVTTARGFSAVRPTTDRKANLDAVASLRRTPWTRDELAQLQDPRLPLTRSVAQFRYDSNPFDDYNSRLALRSISVVKEAVSALRGLPGRKALLLVSEGLAGLGALTLSQVHDLYWPLDRLYGDADDLPGALKRLAELAARAGVVISAVDPRGLVTGGLNAEDAIQVGSGGIELGEVVRARHLALHQEHSTLQYLADQTGGLARLESNDVAGAISSILSDLSGYYLIGYAPAAGTFGDRGFRNFEVKVKRPGLKVRTRKGFYAVTDEQVASALK